MDNLLKHISIIDIALYVLVIGLLSYCLKMERGDIKCPWIGCDPELCKEGNGSKYQNTEPSDTDSPTDLGKKIIKAANIHRRTVYWRRSLLITFVGTLVLWMVLFHRLPTGPELVTSLFILGGMWYFSFNYYNYHHFDHAYHRLIESVKALVECCEGKKVGLETF